VVRSNPAVVRALDILDHLTITEHRPSLRELAQTLGLPKTSAFEIVNTLVARGYLTKDEQEPTRYSLGPRSFQLGSAFANRLDYVAIGRGAATKLSEKTNETSHVAMLDGTDVVYIARAESAHTVRMVSALGARVPAHCTSVGKALLAELSDLEFDRRYPAGQKLPRLTDNTITSPTKLRKDLAQVRTRGYSIEECESNVDVCCTGAAVRDRTGEVVAAISVSVPEYRWAAHPHEHWISLVLDAAGEYSASLGYLPHA
jgi:IclR family transcriptional regulator, KDG regulon repressor